MHVYVCLLYMHVPCTHTYIHMHTHTNPHAHTHTYIHIHTCTQNPCTCMYTCTLQILFMPSVHSYMPTNFCHSRLSLLYVQLLSGVYLDRWEEGLQCPFLCELCATIFFCKNNTFQWIIWIIITTLSRHNCLLPTRHQQSSFSKLQRGILFPGHASHFSLRRVCSCYLTAKASITSLAITIEWVLQVMWA